MAGNTLAPLGAAVAAESATRTPIKHVIVIIGENRSFDHVYATYKPVNKGDHVLNLLSKKIVNDDGSRGRIMAKSCNIRRLTPSHINSILQDALCGAAASGHRGPSTPYGCQFLGVATGTSCVTSANVAAIKAYENGLPDEYYQYL